MSFEDEYSTDAFVNKLRIYNFSSSAQTQLQTSDILMVADDMIREIIFPNLIVLNENYSLYYEDKSTVANQSTYTIPTRAILNMLHSVWIIQNNMKLYLDRINLSDVSASNTLSSQRPISYYLMDYEITFFPSPDTSNYTYRCYYYKRPNKMVILSKAAKVLLVNKLTGLVTYASTPPSTFTSSVRYDFLSHLPPFVFPALDVTGAAPVLSTQLFPIASVQNLNPGDYVCLSGETVAPAIPVELTTLLIRLVMSSMAVAQSDVSRYQMSDKEIKEKIAEIYRIPGPRVTNQSVGLNLMNSPFARW